MLRTEWQPCHPSLADQSPCYAEQRETEVSIDSGAPRDPWIHVHVCIHCGGASRREEFEDRAQTTGIYRCSKCGKEGPLNIQIHAVDTSENDSQKTGGLILLKATCFAPFARLRSVFYRQISQIHSPAWICYRRAQ